MSADRRGQSLEEEGTMPVPFLLAPPRRRRWWSVRRAIGLAILLALAYGIYWTIFLSGVLTPLLAYVEPARELIAWVREDPSRMITAAAVMIIPHIGLYALLFDDRLR